MGWKMLALFWGDVLRVCTRLPSCVRVHARACVRVCVPVYADVCNSDAGNELLVYVFDPSDTGKQPNGKQRISAISSPGGDTYTPSSGIWQTVWLEAAPATYIESLIINQASATVRSSPPLRDISSTREDPIAPPPQWSSHNSCPCHRH